VFQNELIVGGHFSSIGSLTAFHVARWDGTSWSTFGSGLVGFGEVQALAVYNGELYAGGSFNTNSGLDGIAKWNGSAWVAVGGPVTFQSDGVMTLHVASDNTLWAGGEFSAIGGVPAAGVARWNGTTWQAVGGGLPGGMAWAMTEWQGRMIVAGGFDLGNNVRGIAAWNGASFVSVGASGNHGLNGVGLALYATPSHLYVGGDFSLAGVLPTSALARFDGSQWESLGGVGGGAGFPIVTGFAAWQGKVAVAGRFERVGSEIGSGGILCWNSAAWDPAIGGAAGWQAVGEGLGMPGTVLDMVPWRGGYVVAGSGNQLRTNLTWFDGHTYRPLAWFDGPVQKVHEWQGDLIVSGAFQYRDGLPTTRCVRFDGQNWTPMGSVLASDFHEFQGSLYASAGGYLRWNGSSWQQVGFAIADSGDLAEFQGRLYLAGLRSYFQTDGLFDWDGTTMRSVPNGPTNRAHALLPRGNELWIGGEFTQCGTTAIQRLARYDGVTFQQVGTGVPGPQGQGVAVRTLAELDGDLYLGGSFNTQIGFVANYIARWDGTAYRALGSGLNSVVNRIVPEPATGNLWVVGMFTSAAGSPSTGGVPSFGMARYRTRDDWLDLGLPLAGSVGTAHLTGHGAVELGGQFGLRVVGLPPATFGVHVVSFTRIDQPLLGGTLVPNWEAVLGFLSTPVGSHDFTVPVTVLLPLATPLFAQTWCLDTGAAQGVAASNAVTTTSH
jgi:trimeric autotransporter adhesin